MLVIQDHYWYFDTQFKLVYSGQNQTSRIELELVEAPASDCPNIPLISYWCVRCRLTLPGLKASIVGTYPFEVYSSCPWYVRANHKVHMCGTHANSTWCRTACLWNRSTSSRAKPYEKSFQNLVIAFYTDFDLWDALALHCLPTEFMAHPECPLHLYPVPKLVHQASCSRNVFSFGSASKINFLPRWETLSVFLIACLSIRVVSYLESFSTKHAAILVSTKCLLPLVIWSAPGMFRWGFLQSPHLVVSYVLTSGSTMF